MNCPFCHHDITPHKEEYNLGTDSIGYWKLAAYKCPNPECQKLFLYLARLEIERTGPPRHTYIEEKPIECFLIYPKGATRKKAPPEVPIEIAKDFNEAVLILNDSPRASAALSRRCLQNILREKAKVKPGNLSDEIQEIIDRKELPSYLAECLDHIRIIGNFAAHPIKSERTGEIIEFATLFC